MNIRLEPARREELPAFCKQLQEAFSVAVIETFGPQDGGPIPADRDVWESLSAPGGAAYHILLGCQKVGGVVVNINEATQHNALDFFFISPERHSRGLGLAAWKAVEAMYPKTKVWETVTPYFEQRNIHFYVNKCGFHIVEFFNRHHPDPHGSPGGYQNESPFPDEEGFFRFEKVMNQ